MTPKWIEGVDFKRKKKKLLGEPITVIYPISKRYKKWMKNLMRSIKEAD